MYEDETTVKGGFVVELENNEFFFIPFIFNPEEVEEEDGANYKVQEIPGSADPSVDYVSGKGLRLSCTIIVEQYRIDELYEYIDKNPNKDPVEIARRNKFAAVNFTEQDLATSRTFFPRSPSLYVEQIRKLLFPKKNYEGGFLKSPPRVTFLFGDGTFVGRVESFNLVRKLATPKLRLKYAEISIKMIRDQPKAKRFFSVLPSTGGTVVYPLDRRSQQQQVQRGDYVTR
jgi:hypothetical protein